MAKSSKKTVYNSRNNIYDDDYDIRTNQRFAEDDFDEEEYDYYGEPAENQKKSVVKKVILSVLLTLAAFALLFGGVIFVNSLMLPDVTNILIVATDEDGTRTDTIMIGSYNKNSDEINLISVPRDTYVTVSDKTYSAMCESYPEPGSKSMKINAIHHYGGEKYGIDMLRTQIEDITGINIDYYVKIDFEAFRYIIDSVGGIDFYVPQDMYYTDPVQNLTINLQEGMQHLTGAQAEQVVRFRSGYANADLGRIEVQQQFMKAFVSQTLSKKNILSHPKAYYDVLFKYDYIQTDMNFVNIISYAVSLGGFNADAMNSMTLPGSAGYADGQSVYKIQPDETRRAVKEAIAD